MFNLKQLEKRKWHQPFEYEVLLGLPLKAEVLSDVRVHDALEQLERARELIALYQAVHVVDECTADRVRVAQHQAELQLVAGDQRGFMGLLEWRHVGR